MGRTKKSMVETDQPKEKDNNYIIGDRGDTPESEINNILSGYTEGFTFENTNESDEPSVFDSLPDEAKPDFEMPKKQRGRPKKEKNVVVSGEILSGAMFLMLIDLTIPFLISVLNNQFSKTKIKPSDLQLSEKQKAELSPLADQVAKELNIEGNPIAIFVISLLGIYGLNFAMLKQIESKK